MRVLLVDDHPIFRHGLAHVVSAVDAEAVIEHCVNLRDLHNAMARFGDNPCQLATLDLNMPGFEGCDALKQFLEMAPGVPVVVVSGDERPETVRTCIDMGACGYVPKSADSQVLLDAMDIIMQGGTWLPGSSLRIVAPETTPVARSFGGWASLRPPFTPRQRDVLQRVVQGKTNKVIGRELGISDGTVKTHLAHLMAMLGVNTRTQLVYELARQGIRVQDIALEAAQAGAGTVTSQH